MTRPLRVHERLDADTPPLRRVIIVGQEAKAWRASAQALGEVRHDDVVVAVADEQRDVGGEDLQQEASRPGIGEIRVAEIGGGHNEIRQATLDASVQTYDPGEISPKRQRRSTVRKGCLAERARGGIHEMLVIVGGDDADVLGSRKETHQRLV